MEKRMEQDMTHNGEISLSRRTIVRVLAATTLFLLSVSIAGQLAKYALGQQVYRFNRLFYVDFEGNIPTFFSSILLILASSLLWFITVLKKSSQDPYRRHWAILASLCSSWRLTKRSASMSCWIKCGGCRVIEKGASFTMGGSCLVWPWS